MTFFMLTAFNTIKLQLEVLNSYKIQFKAKSLNSGCM